LVARQAMTKIRGYDSMREGAKYFIIILFNHLGISWEKWLHELLGGRPCGA
jgi:hypothetical protein